MAKINNCKCIRCGYDREAIKLFGESCEIKIELSAIKDVEEFSRYYFVPDSFKIDTMNFY